MRSRIVFAATFGVLAATSSGASAADWCGYATRANAVIECGYSTVAGCETAVGKGGMCFVDPELAANAARFTPALATKPGTGRS